MNRLARLPSLFLVLAALGCGAPAPGGGPLPVAGLGADPSIAELSDYLKRSGAIDSVRVGDPYPGHYNLIIKQGGKTSVIAVSKHATPQQAAKHVAETDQGFTWRKFAFVTRVIKDESWINKLRSALPSPAD